MQRYLIRSWRSLPLYVAVFLLPWQTRWMYGTVPLPTGVGEFGVLSLYAVEVFLLLGALILGQLNLSSPYTELGKRILYVLGALCISLSFAPIFSLGLHQIMHVVFALFLFVLVLQNDVSAKAVAWSFVLGLVGPSFLGVWQSMTGGSPAMTMLGLAAKDAAALGVAVVELGGQRVLRAYGSFPHPNIFGGYLMVGIWVLVWLAQKEKMQNRGFIILQYALGVLFGGMIILTFSRSAWLGLGLSCVFFRFLLWRKKVNIAGGAKQLAVAITLGVVLCGAWVFPLVLERTQLSNRLEQQSVSERVSQYRLYDDVLLLNPITGVGPGAYTHAMASLWPNQKVWEYQPMHNAILLLLAEVGLLGLLCVAWFVAAVDEYAFKARKKFEGLWGLSLGAGLFMISLFDHYLWSLWPGLVLVALSLALIARISIEKEK